VTDLEDRLRRDLNQVAEAATVDSIRPLRVPNRRRVPGLVRWLAPVTAMAAVMGVVAGVRLAAEPGPGRALGQFAPQPSPVPGAATAEPAGTPPPYYVTVVQTAPPDVTTTAIVHGSATGAVLATVAVPTLGGTNGWFGPAVTAAADDRTFVITQTADDSTYTQSQAESGNIPQADLHHVTRFYLLSVAANGRSATLRLLPVSLPPTVAPATILGYNDVALSPDGARLALALADCNSASHCYFTGIRVITLATGEASDWTTQVAGSPDDLSWAGDDHVAFYWATAFATGDSYRLLDVAGTGGSLLAAPAFAGQVGGGDALITADSRVVITAVVKDIVQQANGKDTAVSSIVELSASTGRQLQVLYTWTLHGLNRQDASSAAEGCQILSLGPDGVQPLVNCGTFGRLENGKITPLPASPSPGWSGLVGPGGGNADAAW
jgi:hypothetical protein